VVSLIDHRQIGGWQCDGVRADRAGVQRCNACDLDPFSRAWPQAWQQDSMFAANPVQLARGLGDQFAAVREEHYRAAGGRERSRMQRWRATTDDDEHYVYAIAYNEQSRVFSAACPELIDQHRAAIRIPAAQAGNLPAPNRGGGHGRKR